MAFTSYQRAAVHTHGTGIRRTGQGRDDSHEGPCRHGPDLRIEGV